VTDNNRVEFIGADAAMNDLRRWAEQLRPEIDKAVAPLGDRIANIVRSRVPRKSGALAGSVDAHAVDDGIELSMGDGLNYAGWIEFGGSRGREYYPKGRYLYQSMLEQEDEFNQLAATTAADSVGRFAWSTPSA
jgi:hypothetical protein